MQQALQKATFAIACSCNGILTAKTESRTPDEKALLSHNLDAMALIGHVTAELARLKREQLKPALRPEFHALCSADSEHSQLLFGEDLAKPVRDVKGTNRLSGKNLCYRQRRNDKLQWQTSRFLER